MIEIEIDGKTLEAESGSMIIEVADKYGISIPRFCYHKKLSIAANCRMCLVEVEKAPKPLPACATPVTAGMKVSTLSDKTKEAQRAVMEFLLINHPLDCPICDQGGECELQDVSLVYGSDLSRFDEGKRAVVDDNLGSLIETEMTRCIQCTRCVRFGQEIAGQRELGATGRGENMQITTYVKHGMQSELSGNIIDLCPVGALTSKPFRYSARAWELEQTTSVAPHDCVGSNVYLHTLRQKVMRAVPRENERLNETWLSDRDRFSYVGIHSEERVRAPMIKINGEWQETDWVTALAASVNGLRLVQNRFNGEQIAALISPSATTEECYLLQKLLRGLGSNNIDHRLHQTDFADQECLPLYPGLDISLDELDNYENIVLIGSNVRREQPIVAHRIRKANLRGAKIFSLNVCDYDVNFVQEINCVKKPDELVEMLAAIVQTLHEAEQGKLSSEAIELLKDVKTNAQATAIAHSLIKNNKSVILLGAIAHNHPDAATIRTLSQLLAQLCGAKIGYLTEGANSAGAWLAGAVPHRTAGGKVTNSVGKTVQAAVAAHLKVYLLFNIDPDLDCANASLVKSALKNAEHVIAFSPFKSETLMQHADVILPITTFAETEGTYVNLQGQWQSFEAAIKPMDDARPGWKVLRVLANQLNLPGFEYNTIHEIRKELSEQVDNSNVISRTYYPQTLPVTNSNQITRITEWPLYSIDNIVRRSAPLQESPANDPVGIYISFNLARRLQLQDGMAVRVTQGENSQAVLPVILSIRIPDDCALIHAGKTETSNLGATFGAVEIHHAQ